MGRREGKRCAQAGCRAWAMRGTDWCSAHRERPGREVALMAVPEAQVAAPPTMVRWAATREGRHLLSTEIARLIMEAGRVGGLTEEIGTLRALHKRLMNEETDLHYLSEAIPRIVTAIVRAMRTQHLLAGETADDLTEMLTRILNDMGLGE